MDDSAVLEKLSSLGLELPDPPTALASYVPVVVAGSVAQTAGQIALVAGELQSPGSLGRDVTVEEGAECARRCALQALSALRAALGGSFDRLVRIVQVSVWVACTDDFTDHPKVANGASDLLVEVLGEAGRHARAAVGLVSLPMGACVEVAVTAEVSPA